VLVSLAPSPRPQVPHRSVKSTRKLYFKLLSPCAFTLSQRSHRRLDFHLLLLTLHLKQRTSRRSTSQRLSISRIPAHIHPVAANYCPFRPHLRAQAFSLTATVLPEPSAERRSGEEKHRGAVCLGQNRESSRKQQGLARGASASYQHLTAHCAEEALSLTVKSS
jgi:hypothetical protein